MLQPYNFFLRRNIRRHKLRMLPPRTFAIVVLSMICLDLSFTPGGRDGRSFELAFRS